MTMRNEPKASDPSGAEAFCILVMFVENCYNTEKERRGSCYDGYESNIIIFWSNGA